MKIIVFLIILLWSKSTLAQQNLTLDMAKSTEKAIVFLSGEDSGMEYSVYAVYHYLERLYQVPTIYNDTFFIKKMALADSGNLLRLEPFFCLTRTTLPLNIAFFDRYEKESLDRYMAKTLACNTFKLNKNFLNKIAAVSQRGKYELTHTYLMLQWLTELNCNCGNSKKLKNLQIYIKQQILRLLEADANNWDDVYLEALALLCYTDGKKYIRQEWLNAIIQHQMPNGGWKHFNETANSSSAHPTVFALWILLAYQSQTTPSIKWIYPNPQKK
jgi:hypothetical protein